MYGLQDDFYSVAEYREGKFFRKTGWNRSRETAWKMRDKQDQLHGACANGCDDNCPSYRVLMNGDINREDDRPPGSVKCP